MPGQIRPNAKLAKIAYDLLKVSPEKRQKNEPNPSERRVYSWTVQSNTSA